MKKLALLPTFLLVTSLVAFAQPEFGLFGGVSNYSGDLSEDNSVSLLNSKPSYGFFFRGNPTKYFSFKVNLYAGSLHGSDANSSKSYARVRNLNFQSNIFELSFTPQFNIETILFRNGNKLIPYISGGIGLFYFNPKTEYQGSVIELQPLGTEGQGFETGEPRYSRISASFPIGGGIKYTVSDLVSVGFDWGARPTLTDYIDDVSTVYPNMEELARVNGYTAVLLSDRTAEFTGVPSRYKPGHQRGNPEIKDWYFMGGVYVSVHLGQNRAYADEIGHRK